MSAKSVCFLIVISWLASGCAATTELTNAWVDPSYKGPPFQKLLVLGVAKTPGDRRTFEDQFSARLREDGVDAVQSYTVLPEAEKVEKGVLEGELKKMNADGVIVARVISVENKTQYSPGYVTTVPTYGYPGFYDYYNSIGPTVHSYDVVMVETSLWQTSDSRLVWSATTKTVDPAEISKEIPGYAKIITGALVERGLINGGR